jgi:hypothetical protein
MQDHQASDQVEPTLHLLRRVQLLSREDGTEGGLVPDEEATHRWTTKVQLDGTMFARTFRQEFNAQDGNTLGELLKITGNYCSRGMGEWLCGNSIAYD